MKPLKFLSAKVSFFNFGGLFYPSLDCFIIFASIFSPATYVMKSASNEEIALSVDFLRKLTMEFKE